MADFALDFATGDLVLTGSRGFSEQGGLGEAIFLCLFLDARALEGDELPDPNSDDPRGWWGDALADFPGDQYGSRLWTFRRSKNTARTRTRMRDACLEALQVLRDQGIARSIEVEVVANPDDPSAVQITVSAEEETGEIQAYAWAWDLVRGRTL